MIDGIDHHDDEDNDDDDEDNNDSNFITLIEMAILCSHSIGRLILPRLLIMNTEGLFNQY